MSAAARTLPDDPDPTLVPTWLDAGRRRDPLVTAVALGLAVLLHAAVLLLVAFPERALPLRPQVPAPDPPKLIRFHPPPPPLEPPPKLPATALGRRIPVPEPDPPELEPLREEPVVEFPFESDPAAFVELGFEPVAPPAPAPETRRIPGFGGVSHPVLLHKVEPLYPEMPRRARLGGEVILEAVIGRDGSVGELRVLRGSPVGVGFEQAAIEAVSRWRYEPALQDGRPVEVYLTVEVRFTIR